ncbi:MAG: hypothetical protein HYW69_01415 [Candidatus Nealsonbacteria bacterium]|nr:hypothetical protein [Candidatus Nealsonbacteria bacterium]
MSKGLDRFFVWCYTVMLNPDKPIGVNKNAGGKKLAKQAEGKIVFGEEVRERLGERFGRNHVHAEGDGKPERNRGEKKHGQKPARVETIRQVKKEEPMKPQTIPVARPQTTTRAPQTTAREYTPFGSALWNARQITTRRPDQEQVEIFTALQKAVSQLDEDGKRNLVFRLQKEVMEDKGCGIPGLFTVCRMARMLAVAASTAAVRQTGLTFGGLQAAGLAEAKPGRDGKDAYVVYKFGALNLVEAAKKLRRNSNVTAAKVLEEHISRGERNRALREAQKAQAPAEAEA